MKKILNIFNILNLRKRYIHSCAAMLGIIVLSACGSDEEDPITKEEQQAITFDSSKAEMTRATELSDYGITSFKLYGVKNSSGNKTVFDNYTVSYTSNSGGTTASNSSGWEYVSAALNQTIKYWDYSATSYSFSAVAGTPAAGATFAINGEKNEASYTGISITSDNLTSANALYFTQPCQILPANYANTVKLQFTPYLCKVRIGFYENMDGFSVQNLTFGTTNTTNLEATSTFVDEGACSLTYNYGNNTLVTSVTPTATSPTKDFGEVQYSSKSSASAAANDLLGTSSDNASFTLGGGATNDYFVTMLPYEGNTTPITITCTYEAVQSNGTITKIKNIPATVPAEYAQWKPGYEYSYIFKVSDSNITLVEINQVAIKQWGYDNSKYVDHPVYNW